MSSGNSRFYLTAEMHDAVDRKSDISGDGSPYLRARRVNRNPSQTSLGSDKGTRELTLHFNFARNVLLINYCFVMIVKVRLIFVHSNVGSFFDFLQQKSGGNSKLQTPVPPSFLTPRPDSRRYSSTSEVYHYEQNDYVVLGKNHK